jgi:predicted CXXCH cytochrome family protein
VIDDVCQGRLELSLLSKFTKLLILASVIVICASVLSFAAKECTDCHSEVESKARRGRFIHSPVMKGQCHQCHIAGKVVTAPVKKTAAVVEKQKNEKIRWFKTPTQRDVEQMIRLPKESLAAELYLRASDGRLRTPVVKITQPKDGKIKTLTDDQQPPKQSAIRVSDVRRGISSTATIEWQTDEYTDSIIYYGIDNIRSVNADRQLARRHSQVLLGLDSDETYQFQIVSRDLYGNQTKSEVMNFSTAKSFWEQSASYNTQAIFSSDIELQWELSRLADDFLLQVKADRPVTVSLGMPKKNNNKAKVERNVATSGTFSHPILKSSFDTNITVCKTCHQELREEYSHPIKVRASRGMTIPKDYPLLSDGTMSCMTCHDSHASNYEHRLRKSKKADLCRGCHKNY